MNAVNTQRQNELATATLVRLAQAGDAGAFGHLFERFQAVVQAIAFQRLGNHAEAQELTQDVFIRAMEKLNQLRVPEAFVGWLRQITVRMAINRAVRRDPCSPVEPETLAGTLEADASPLDDVLRCERRSQVRDCLRRLGDTDRRTLESHYFEGRSLKEMADQFDAPIGTIKRRLHVARKRLAEEVEETVGA